jgi:hypothetical protein
MKRNDLVSVFLSSHGKHTESVVVADNAGAAYQITLQLARLPLRPIITVSEYVPETPPRVLQQYSVRVWFFGLSSALDASLQQLQSWMVRHHGRRLGKDEDVKLARKIYEAT